jgi:hypothetical protein
MLRAARGRSGTPATGGHYGADRMRHDLTSDELAAALDAWEGTAVAVRIVTESNQLVAAFRGVLGERSRSKRPSMFWPLLIPDVDQRAEQVGLYLHPEHFDKAAVHADPGVLELVQDGVRLSVRRL